jgi:quinolinate synthase
MSSRALARLVRGGIVSELEAPRVAGLWDEIGRLKRDKRAFIPAHNYQVPEVQAVADLVGDSFELAVKVRDLPPSHGALVVFCGVRFMAEACHTLSPARPVYLPNLDARCSLAEVDADDVAERQDFLRAAGRRFATMVYVNTYADVKALADTCCTSANAARIAGRLGVPDVLFIPDQNLAYQVALATKRTYLPPPEPHRFHPREYAEMIEPLIREGKEQGLEGNVFAWEGACHVHQQMSVGDVARIREDDPGATVIVHGEVCPELQRAADAVLSTAQMAAYVAAHPERTRYAILTECGLVVRLELEHPEKQFYKPCRLCRYMKAIDLESVYRTLRDEPADRRVTVPHGVRAGAARAMLRMIELGA